MNGAPPPPPPPYGGPPATPARQGLHPLAWVAIGCAALLVVGAIAVAGLGWFAVTKTKQFAEKMEANPAKTMAETIVRFNPDLELVSSDDQAGTVTIKNTKTGEIGTFDYSQIQDGKLSFETADGKGAFSLDASDGGVTVKSDDGEATFGTNAGDAPEWIPLYPGVTSLTSGFSSRTAQGRAGIAAAETTDPPSEVAGWYEQEMKDSGYEINTTGTMQSGGDVVSTVIGTSKSPPRSLTVVATGTGGKTQIAINYTEGES